MKCAVNCDTAVVTIGEDHFRGQARPWRNIDPTTVTKLVLGLLLIFSGFSSFAKDDGEPRVVSLVYRQIPATDLERIKHLNECGISGHPIAIIRDPVRSGIEGIYLFVDKFDANVFCRDDSFVFLRDRSFRKRLAALFDSGTSVLLNVGEDSSWTALALPAPELLAQKIRLSIGQDPDQSDFLILSRWASLYIYSSTERQLFDWRFLNERLEKNLRGINVEPSLFQDIKDFILDSRGIESLLIEIDEAQGRTEYQIENQVVVAVTDGDSYRSVTKLAMLKHMQSRAHDLGLKLRALANEHPRDFRVILGAVNSLVPTKIMKRLGISNEFDFDLKTATCVVDLTQARQRKLNAVESPKSDN